MEKPSPTAWRKAGPWPMRRRHARVTQMGNHIHNTGRNYRDVVEIVQSGSLGASRVAVLADLECRPYQQRPATQPAELDYDFWLGPAPKRPYDPLRSHLTFRNFWDYSGGTFIDFWCHIMDVAVWALDLKAPRSVSAMGGRFVVNDATETPDTMEAMLEYPNCSLVQPAPTPPPGSSIWVASAASSKAPKARSSPTTQARTVGEGQAGRELHASGPDHPGFSRTHARIPRRHQARNIETTCNVRYGHRVTKPGLLSNIAYRTGRRLPWDERGSASSAKRRQPAICGANFCEDYKL